MKTQTTTLICLSLFLLFIVSCDKEEMGPGSNSDISAQVSEFPRSGDLVSTVTSTLEGDLTFALGTLSVNDAFLINETTGDLTVANPGAFDYEANTEITGEVVVTNSTDTEVLSLFVEILDVDDIEHILTDSKSAYQNASNGTWVAITSTEYLRLSVQIAQTSKSGITEEFLERGLSVGRFFTYDDSTVANDLAPIPENSYVYAFRYYSDEGGVEGNKVKVSSSTLTQGYEDLGSSLPASIQGDLNHYVLKGANSRTDGGGFLGMYSQAGLSYDVLGEASGTHYFIDGDQADLGNNFNVAQRICLYQGLSTPIKQWD